MAAREEGTAAMAECLETANLVTADRVQTGHQELARLSTAPAFQVHRAHKCRLSRPRTRLALPTRARR